MEALRQFPICAAIADHLLQGPTGTQFARDVKKIKRRLPIILLSETVPENLDGIDICLNKAESAARFLDILRALVELHRA